MAESGATPLSTACKKGFVDIAEALVDAGAPIDSEAYYQAIRVRVRVRVGVRVRVTIDSEAYYQAPFERCPFTLL